ncbi:MAG: hypothetical protein AAGE43_10320 [Pseudomonadota bacterium]
MTYEWHDLVGNLGVLLVLGTYLGVQMERMDVRQPAYSLANALGAVLIIVSLNFNFNLSSFIIEIAWLSISLLGLYRSWRQRQRAS